MWSSMMEWSARWGEGWGLFGVMHMLWWLLILLAVIALLRWVFVARPIGAPDLEGDRALAILRERYARGEIDKTEFEERKRSLRA